MTRPTTSSRVPATGHATAASPPAALGPARGQAVAR